MCQDREWRRIAPGTLNRSCRLYGRVPLDLTQPDEPRRYADNVTAQTRSTVGGGLASRSRRSGVGSHEEWVASQHFLGPVGSSPRVRECSAMDRLTRSYDKSSRKML